MPKLRYPFLPNILFYAAVGNYVYLVGSMTLNLWFGDGVNIFASYTAVTEPAAFVVDANKVYWSKTGFLFLTMLLFALNFDYRAALGLAMTFWSVSLILMFGPTQTLIGATVLAVALVALQVYRKEVWTRAV